MILQSVLFHAHRFLPFRNNLLQSDLIPVPMPGRFPAIGSEMRKLRFFPYNVRAKKMFRILWDGEIGGDEVVRAEIPEATSR